MMLHTVTCSSVMMSTEGVKNHPIKEEKLKSSYIGFKPKTFQYCSGALTSVSTSHTLYLPQIGIFFCS